ncbi:MAG: zinc ribbon domain-containing protein [Calditrichaeota bacterium]|nr:zinc ribbon domain-containing protein [Calditrichota bacterium]
MSYVIATFLSLGILGYVLYPLFQTKYRLHYVPFDLEDPDLSVLKKTKNELLSAIKEIEFEFRMGKIASDDYEKLKTDYQNRALHVLKKIDEFDNGEPGSGDLESEISKYKQQLKTASPIRGDAKFCTQCGKKNEAGYKYCFNCGEKL